MAIEDVTRQGVERAIQEFDRIGLDAMLCKYGGGKSTKWYLEYSGWPYDQKLILRAAHGLQGLGSLLPGRGTFTAGHARRHLEKLGFSVVKREPSRVAQ